MAYPFAPYPGVHGRLDGTSQGGFRAPRRASPVDSIGRGYRTSLKPKTSPRALAAATRKILFEPLEPRILLSADPLSFTAASAAELTLKLEDQGGVETLVLRDDSGAVLAQRALADTSSVQIFGSAGDDTLSVDFTNPFATPVHYEAGAGFDDLIIGGGFFSAIAYEASGPDAGTIEPEGAGTITYSGIEPITDNLDVADRVFTASPIGDVIRLENDPLAGQMSISSDNGSFESVTFNNPLFTLTINAGGGDDTLIIGELDPGFVPGQLVLGQPELHINMGAGTDTLTMERNAALVISNLQLTAGTEIVMFDDAPERAILAGDSISGAAFSGSVIFSQGLPQWQSQGPGPITGGQVAGIATEPVIGAIEAVATDPGNANVIYVGTVGGGIWKTTNGGNNWVALTDQFPSLSITALAIDPSNSNIVYAGTGTSSSSAIAGQPIGLLKSTDGGANWQVIRKSFLLNRTINAIVVTSGGVLLVGTQATNFGAMPNQLGGGLLRSTNGGRTFFKISGNANDTLNNDNDGSTDEADENTGLPGGTVTDITLDPGDTTRVYVGMQNQGVFVSTNSGRSFNAANTGIPNAANATRVLLAASPSADTGTGNRPAYAMVLTQQFAGVTTAATGLGTATLNSAIVGPGSLLEPGDAVTISGGGNAQNVTITRTAPAGGGNLQLSFNANLTANYPAPATVQTQFVQTRLSGVFRSANNGTSWTAMDLPGTNETFGFVGIHNGGQGTRHGSI
ncbi:MAG: LEPR-XLL domain-containing protein, partial [Gammaproteobacteria bacterium]